MRRLPCAWRLFQNRTVTRRNHQPSTSASSQSQPIDEDRQVVQSRSNPSTLVTAELSHIRGNLLGLLGSTHPGFSELAHYYFLQPSKQLRSLVVLLFARATNGLGQNWDAKLSGARADVEQGRSADLDWPLHSNSLLTFEIQTSEQPTPPPRSSSFSRPKTPHFVVPQLLPTQIRLAQIVEMIHMASILHDGVYDDDNLSSGQSHGSTDAFKGFGNKFSILGGDFLLGRASTALARLRESEVLELVAAVISNLVEGEMLRMENSGTALERSHGQKVPSEISWDAYFREAYLKTASLIAKSARAAVILGGSAEKDIWKDVAYAYGRNLGIAYELIQDTLNWEAGSDKVKFRIATAPALFAREEYPELQSLVNANGDVNLAVQCVLRSSGVERTKLLAQTYTERAKEVLRLLPDGEARKALDVLADCIIDQTWYHT